LKAIFFVDRVLSLIAVLLDSTLGDSLPVNAGSLAQFLFSSVSTGADLLAGHV